MISTTKKQRSYLHNIEKLRRLRKNVCWMQLYSLIYIACSITPSRTVFRPDSPKEPSENHQSASMKQGKVFSFILSQDSFNCSGLGILGFETCRSLNLIFCKSRVTFLSWSLQSWRDLNMSHAGVQRERALTHRWREPLSPKGFHCHCERWIYHCHGKFQHCCSSEFSFFFFSFLRWCSSKRFSSC